MKLGNEIAFENQVFPEVAENPQSSLKNQMVRQPVTRMFLEKGTW